MRFEVGKHYLIHGKWEAIAVNMDGSLMGFEIKDASSNFVPAKRDGLYYFSNSATIEEDVQKNRNIKLNELGI